MLLLLFRDLDKFVSLSHDVVLMRLVFTREEDADGGSDLTGNNMKAKAEEGMRNFLIRHLGKKKKLVYSLSRLECVFIGPLS